MKNRQIYILLSCFLMLFLGCKKIPKLDNHFVAFNQKNQQDYDIKILYKNGTSNINKVFFVFPFIRDIKKVHKLEDLLNDVAENLPSNTTAVLIGIENSSKLLTSYIPVDIIPSTLDTIENADLFLPFITTHIDSMLLSRNIYEATDTKVLIGGDVTGIATTYAFLTQNDFFSSYCIFNPNFTEYQEFFQLAVMNPEVPQEDTAKFYISMEADRDEGHLVNFAQLKTVLEESYPNVDLATDLITGTNRKVREESLKLGLKFISE